MIIRKNIIKTLAILLIIFILLASTFAYMNYISQPRFFDKNLWDNNVNRRRTMLDSLRKDYNFTQMTKDDVIELLGENYMSVREGALTYQLRRGRNLSDTDFISFYFDENGNYIIW